MGVTSVVGVIWKFLLQARPLAKSWDRHRHNIFAVVIVFGTFSVHLLWTSNLQNAVLTMNRKYFCFMWGSSITQNDTISGLNFLLIHFSLDYEILGFTNPIH